MRSISLPHSHGSSIEKHIDSIPKTEDFQNLSDVFRLLGDSSRLRIFWILCHCEECVINISAMMEMSSPAVSHHLKMLKASKLIVSRRDGKEVYYQAAHTEQAELLHQMIETLLAITCPGSCQT
ncbi:MAG: winged helix-turn-helix transcriptional regulator [Lachnospiraceae bacterium]|jgi:Predicted transcriptional regulators|nr:winged helix-turn-helix transcriptional regulator [Lachnospiraceae bacterium]